MNESNKPQLTTQDKLIKVAEKLNNGVKPKFDFYQLHYYLAYDFNTKSVMQLVGSNAFKIQGVIYCLSPHFKECALQFIDKKELEEYLKC